MAMAHANQKAVPTFSECSRSRRSPEFCLVASLTVHSGVFDGPHESVAATSGI